MPSGIIMQSGSIGAKEEDIQAVLEKNGFEVEKPEAVAAAEQPVEPKREDFKTQEEFDAAQETFVTKQEEAAAAAEEEEERKAEEQRKKEERQTPHLTRKQKAIDKATRELREENRKLADRLAALEGGKKPQPQAAPELKAPKREDFKSDEEFQDALFDHRYKLRRAKEDAEAAQSAITERLKDNLENYQAQVADFKETVDDWDEVVAGNKTPIHESVFLAVQEQENGAQVTYYLGKHPDYARKLAELTPLSAVMEIGRLAERLKTGAPEPRKTQSGVISKTRPRIPEPVQPVSTAATTSTVTSAEAAKKRDFKAFKAAQRAGR